MKVQIKRRYSDPKAVQQEPANFDTIEARCMSPLILSYTYKTQALKDLNQMAIHNRFNFTLSERMSSLTPKINAG